MTDPAFALPFIRIGPEQPLSPVILSVPHAGRAYSTELLKSARLPRMTLEALEDRLVDRLVWRATAAGLDVENFECLSFRRCAQHDAIPRSRLLELAGKYKDNPRVQVLMVSVDQDPEDWRRFLQSGGSEGNPGLDLHVDGGFESEYGTRYNVNFIPKYILIGKGGRIIKADITEPSLGVEQLIEEALEEEAPSI